MTRLSVNINKIATIRNARGGNMPDVEKAAVDCERFGAEGITVHPRPDERHIRYSDVRAIRPLVKTEFNIEGNPIPSFVDLVLEVVPDQVTLVPDAHDAITSNKGWDTIRNREFLTEICKTFKAKGIRTSIFIDPDPAMAEGAKACGCDRVELYTADYAALYPSGPQKAIKPYLRTAEKVREVYKEAVIHIVPTKSMAEGFLAMSAFKADSSVADNEKAMNDSLNGVHTGLIAKADKTGVYNGVSVTSGDFIGVLDDDIITCADSDLKKCLVKFVPTVPRCADYKSVKVFAGKEEDKAVADSVMSQIKDICPEAEISSCIGGQNIYNYVIAFS